MEPQHKGIVFGPSNPQKRDMARHLRREQTHAEGLLWSELRGRQLDGLKFRRQQVIEGFIVDFYCDAARLVVECDGGLHTTQREYDEMRDAILQARGLVVVRFSNEEIVGDTNAVLEHVRAVAAGCLAGGCMAPSPEAVGPCE